MTAMVAALGGLFVLTAPLATCPVETQASTFQVKITPEYRQTMARSMLTLLNEWRAGSTWYYDSSNKKVYLNNLKPLTYDYTLEQHAMQRAAEIAISFDHTRPRGDSKTGISGYMAFGENIAATTNTDGGLAKYALEMYKEENYPYSGQGHRRLMLSVPGNFSNIGIACVYYRGAYYWCQTYGMGSNPDRRVTVAFNGEKTMTVDVETSMLTSRAADLSELNDWQANLKKGQTDYLPEVNLSIATTDTWPYPAASVQGIPTWSTSNANTVTVNSNAGTITAVNAGEANVSMNEPITGASKSKTVTVTDPNAVTGVSLNKTSISLNVGASSSLTATVSPVSAANKSVTWSSSNTAVATVSNSGVVKGVKPGTATITVRTASGGKTATCKVTVKDVVPTGVTLNKSALSMYEGDSLSLVATVLPSNATNKNVTWSSSNTSVATVDAKGMVTGKKAGTATITARTASGSKTATCAVTVKEVEKTFTGIAMVNGVRTYVVKGVPDYTFSGIAKATSGEWLYVKNGVFDGTFEGIAKSTKGNWLYVKNGKWDSTFSGIARSTKGNWLYVENGRYNTAFTGVAKSTKGNWLFVKAGRYDTSFTGVARTKAGTWMYMKSGRWVNTHEGVAKTIDGKWYYVKNGKWDNTFTGIAYEASSAKWVFVRKGVKDTTFTGAAKSTKGNWMYVKNGVWDNTYKGIATVVNSSTKYYMENGRWKNTFTGRYGGYNIVKGVVS